MATVTDPTVIGALPSFPGPIGTKRRRMRSGGNVSTLSNNAPKPSKASEMDEDEVEEKTAQTSKCKGATTIPIFLKKTYKMIDTCNPAIASWTAEGDMFVVKDPDVFATEVIPQYFDHNKFSSFARQLNFYGFRKMQSKPIRNSDYDEAAAKHVTFYNENFKRGRCDLLKKIQRSTRGGGSNTPQDHQRDIQILRDQISTLEQKMTDMATQHEERVRRLELDMLARMESMMLTVQQQQQTQLQLQKAASVGSAPSAQGSAPAPIGGVNWDPAAFNYARASSIASGIHSVGTLSVANPPVSNQANHTNVGREVTFQQQPENKPSAAPTLPPHPKQKQLPLSGLPGSMGAPPVRMNSLRGISQLSRGISGLSRGASVESSASAVLLRNSWEDKFFSMIMLDGNEAGNQQQGAEQSNGPAPATVSDRSIDANGNPTGSTPNNDDLSSVSSSDMP